MASGTGCGGPITSTNFILIAVRSDCGNLNDLLPTAQAPFIASLYPRPYTLPTDTARVPAIEHAVAQTVLPQAYESPVLFQNITNPYQGETLIRFYLPTEDNATLTIQDVTGRVVFRRSSHFTAGIHELTIRQEEIGAQHIFFYTLQTRTFREVRKMIAVH